MCLQSTRYLSLILLCTFCLLSSRDVVSFSCQRCSMWRCLLALPFPPDILKYISSKHVLCASICLCGTYLVPSMYECSGRGQKDERIEAHLHRLTKAHQMLRRRLGRSDAGSGILKNSADVMRAHMTYRRAVIATILTKLPISMSLRRARNATRHPPTTVAGAQAHFQ